MEQNKWHNKINELLPQIGSEFSILDAEVDMDIQKRYLLSSKQVKAEKKEKGEINIDENISILRNEECLIEEQEIALTRLASSDKVEAYRAIESYLKTVKPESLSWTQLAFQESRVRIESVLTGKKPVFISSGLGGRNSLLRFFVVIFNTVETGLEEFQKNLFNSVFSESIVKDKGEIEEIYFEEEYTKMVVLLPLKADIQNTFRRAMTECNEYGNFLRQELLITNVKRLDKEEIMKMLQEDDNQPTETNEDDDFEFPKEEQN